MICYTVTISNTTHKKVHPCLGDSKHHQSRINNTILKTRKDQTQSSVTGLFIMLRKSVSINVCRKLTNGPCGLSLACFHNPKLIRKNISVIWEFKIILLLLRVNTKGETATCRYRSLDRHKRIAKIFKSQVNKNATVGVCYLSSLLLNNILGSLC